MKVPSWLTQEFLLNCLVSAEEFEEDFQFEINVFLFGAPCLVQAVEMPSGLVHLPALSALVRLWSLVYVGKQHWICYH